MRKRFIVCSPDFTFYAYPFGSDLIFLSYATMQFSKRMARTEGAREQTLEQLYQLPDVEE